MSDGESGSRGSGMPDTARDAREMVPPPTTDAIDALIDAVSAGGAPAASSSPGGRSGRGSGHRSSSRWPALRALDAATMRVLLPSLVAFALGAIVAVWALRVLDPTPRPIARAAPPPPRVTPPRETGPTSRPPTGATAPAAPATKEAGTVPSTTAPTTPPVVARAEPRTVPSSLPGVSRPTSPTSAPRLGSAGRQPAAPTATVAARAVDQRTSDRVRTEPNRVSATSPPAEPPASFAISPPAATTALSLPESAVSAPLSMPTVTVPSEVSPIAADQRAVLRTVGRYRTALARLDAADAVVVWPSVDRVALGRAFESLRSQGLEFENCEVQLDRLSATARCRGVAEYVRKVGSATPRRGRYEWTFNMRKAGPDWTIEQVTTARLGPGPSEPSTSNR